ncbi:low-specificity L-threonine aldolase [bacterium]|nr:low-specificity L-threonine aldolase [bacterium]
MIDLRSDTVTKPTQAMRKAMAEAEVGDDVFGEDPSVNRLQEKVAGLLGKSEGLFLPSGTMSNQICIKAQTQPGDEIICEKNAHLYIYEAGGPAFHSSVQVMPVPGRLGVLTAEQIEEAVRPRNIHNPVTRLICLENTHNRAGGTVFPLEEIRRIRKTADAHGLKMHLDGARLWNAEAATGIPLKTWAQSFDSVAVCFSKGLGAPVGSLIAGDEAFIEKARRYRKLFGGGMRQAGILAAAAMHALDHHVKRLTDDHRNAKRLAEAIAGLSAFRVDMDAVQTNIVYFETCDPGLSAEEAVHRLGEKGVAVLAVGPCRIRAVLHLDIGKEQVEEAIGIFRLVFKP